MCTFLLTSAYLTQKKSENYSHAVYKVQSVAEKWKADMLTTQNGGYVEEYNSKWDKTTEKTKFILKLTEDTSELMSEAKVEISHASGEEIFTLHVKK